MTDVVTNHMAYPGCRSCVDYSVFNPFNSSSYYHSPCTIDFGNPTSIQQCWLGDDLVALADLRTENQNVRDVWNTWIAQMVAKYQIDGLRIDSAQEVEQTFWPPFGKAAGVYQVGEVLNPDPNFVIPYQKFFGGLLNYPLYFWITHAFQSSGGDISSLVNGIKSMRAQGADLSLFGTFSENHDQVRFPSQTADVSLAKNIIAFTILFDGIPIIYQGQEQHLSGGSPPNNREALWLTKYDTTAELYGWTSILNNIRSRAIQQDQNYLSSNTSTIYSDQHVVAMRKGFDGYQIISVYANVGAGQTFNVTLSSAQTGFKAGDQLVEVTKCATSKVDANGNLVATSPNGEPKVFYPLNRLSGSGICTSLTGMMTRCQVLR
jgi:alpha-amylase